MGNKKIILIASALACILIMFSFSPNPETTPVKDTHENSASSSYISPSSSTQDDKQTSEQKQDIEKNTTPPDQENLSPAGPQDDGEIINKLGMTLAANRYSDEIAPGKRAHEPITITFTFTNHGVTPINLDTFDLMNDFMYLEVKSPGGYKSIHSYYEWQPNQPLPKFLSSEHASKLLEPGATVSFSCELLPILWPMQRPDWKQGRFKRTFNHFGDAPFIKGHTGRYTFRLIYDSKSHYANRSNVENWIGKLHSNSIEVDFKKYALEDDPDNPNISWYRTYFDSGQISGETRYVNGKPDGLSRTYYPTGQIESEHEFLQGQLKKNTYRNFLQDGSLFEKMYLDEDGNKVKETYFKNGIVRSRDLLTHSEDKFVHEEFYESGELQHRHHEQVGTNQFTSHPTLLRHGPWIYFDKQGNENGLTSYQNGIKHGPKRSYYSNGQLKMEVNYVDGKEEGQKKRYHPNGQLKEVATYVNGKMNGVCRTYDEDGNLTSESVFENGKRIKQ